MKALHRKTQRILLAGKKLRELNGIREHLELPLAECESVMDIETARQLMACRRFDLIVLDSMLAPDAEMKQMKNMVEMLKSRCNGIKIVVFNGVSNRTIQRRIRRRGADGYLSSKNDMKKVAGSVRKLLGL